MMCPVQSSRISSPLDGVHCRRSSLRAVSVKRFHYSYRGVSRCVIVYRACAYPSGTCARTWPLPRQRGGARTAPSGDCGGGPVVGDGAARWRQATPADDAGDASTNHRRRQRLVTSHRQGHWAFDCVYFVGVDSRGARGPRVPDILLKVLRKYKRELQS